MYSFKCPFCSDTFPLISDTYSSYSSTFYRSDGAALARENSYICVNFYRCPSCNEISIVIKGHGDKLNDIEVPIYPNSLAKQLPDYIPQAIKNDYSEAYSIVNLSPKASATLARRCLQGMIRDFWKITKNTLSQEINELNGKVPVAQWNVINKVRKIGNIGAHMEKDVNTIIDIEPGEAEKLLKLIELLIDKWYVQRHDEEELYKSIDNIDSQKQLQKSSN